jgi:hypothetical protein
LSVKAPTGFWPALHLLLTRLDGAGQSHDERMTALTQSYARMSPPARRDMLRELRTVATALNELEPLVMVEALHDAQSRPRDRGGVA